MSAREQILASVRRALATADAETAEVPRGYRDLPTPRGLLDLFAERVADYRATVEHCAPDQVEETIARAVSGRSVVVPPGLPWQVAGAAIDTGQSAYELDRVDAVVTAAAVGIAQTGTIVLDHQPDQGRRAISLVPDLHVCVIRAEQVVHTVPEAVDRLDASRAQTWVSGPSATSDIELNRVEGVHGPRTLHVVIVAESA